VLAIFGPRPPAAASILGHAFICIVLQLVLTASVTAHQDLPQGRLLHAELKSSSWHGACVWAAEFFIRSVSMLNEERKNHKYRISLFGHDQTIVCLIHRRLVLVLNFFQQ
jgi:hypothetical protein